MNPEVRLIFDFMLLTPGQRTAFAIRCAMAVYKEESFVQWANGWLAGSDRSREAARAAMAADRAADWAARAAWDAANVAATCATTRAAEIDSRVAAVVYWAIKVNPDLNLTAIAEEALATHREEE